MKWAYKKQNNFNIYNTAFKKKYLYISLSKSQWHGLKFPRYRAKHTGIDNFRSILALLPPKNPKKQKFERWKNYRYHHFTHVYWKSQSYDLWFLKYWVRQRIFCHVGLFFALLPYAPPLPPIHPLLISKIKIL